MLAAPLAALAGAGATALIGAMATDMWQGARNGIVRLFGRGGDPGEDVLGGQLDGDAVLVVRADPADADQVRQELVPVWRRRLARLLAEHPDAEDELRKLVAQVRSGLPAQPRMWVHTNIARDNSTLFAVQHGNIHHQSPPGEVPPPADDAERTS